MNAKMSGRTFLTVYEAHLAFRKRDNKTAPNTLENYRSGRGALMPLLQLPVSAVTRGPINQFRDKMLETRAPSSINLLMAMASTSWRWGLDRELVPHEWPAIKRLEETPNRKRPLTDAECVRVLTWIHARRPHYLPAFWVLWETGLRASEVCGIDETDIDRTTGRIDIRGGHLNQDGTRRTKTRRSRRSVFVSPECVAMLPVRAGATFRQFCDPSARLTRHAITAVMLDAGRALGLTDVDLHSFRRAWVDTAENRIDAPRQMAMRLTGHSSEATFVSYQRNAQADLGVLSDLSAQVREARQVPLKQVSMSYTSTCSDQVPDGAEVAADAGPEESGDLHLEVLVRVAGLGPEYRAALVALCADADLRSGLVRALGPGAG